MSCSRATMISATGTVSSQVRVRRNLSGQRCGPVIRSCFGTASHSAGTWARFAAPRILPVIRCLSNCAVELRRQAHGDLVGGHGGGIAIPRVEVGEYGLV